MDEKDPLTFDVIGAAIEVHREMGPGLLESIYQKCMEMELKLRGLKFQSQARLPLTYKGFPLDEDDLRMDIYIPGKLVVELKAVEKLAPVHQAQLLTYLRLTQCRVGLLINFNVPVLKDGLKRMVSLTSLQGFFTLNTTPQKHENTECTCLSLCLCASVVKHSSDQTHDATTYPRRSQKLRLPQLLRQRRDAAKPHSQTACWRNHL